MKDENQKPKVGMIVIHCGIRCRISKVHQFGTIDIEEIHGNRSWRISGIGF